MHRKRFRVREARDATSARSRSRRRMRRDNEREGKKHVLRRILRHLVGSQVAYRWKTVKKFETEFGTFEFKVKQYYVRYIDENRLRRQMRREADKQYDMPLGRRILRSIMRTLRRELRPIESEIEAWKTLYEIARGRAKVLLRVTHVVFPFVLLRHWAYDKHLLDYPPPVRQSLVERILDWSRYKYVPEGELRETPWNALVREFLAYYMPPNCNFSMYAVRVSPVTFQFMKGLSVTLYVLRWVKASEIKSDPYIGSARRKSPEQVRWTYKPDVEVVNSRLYVGSYVLTDLSKKVPIDVNELYEPITKVSIRDIMFRPHLVKYYFAKANGKPEDWYNFHHCSLYAIVERKVSRAKIDEIQMRRGLRRWYITSGRRRPWKEYVSSVKYHS